MVISVTTNQFNINNVYLYMYNRINLILYAEAKYKSAFVY